ncbi:TrmH family RNA methyltransferase [Dictyoglomus thermophilum]|uniref:23S rRNA methyltransferase n=1 Tax=Dictyoglomus thermophilum (strain ATCC 35947 / DSM 3960 / H-6-12) TaxID=309799 RepID=B5YER6_DICT6|nr:RNA methyltransferase [Dictyoglomus thermophilum]ACI18496.1 23S rRNA methyltransferase [Dictyoglomus thermophilum H-6-12]
MKFISSPSNEVIKEVIKLHDKNKRKKLNKCLVEGWRLIQDAKENGISIEKLIISKSLWNKKREEILEKFSSCDLYIVEDNLMNKISLMETPPGIMGVFPLFLSPKWEILKNKDNKIVLYSDDIQDPGNLGTIIRVADGVGVDAFILSENTVDPYNYKVIRASTGSIFRVPIWISDDKTFVEFFKDWKIVIADPKGSKLYFEENFKESFVLILGNEAWGIKKEKYLDLNPILLRIPLRKGVDSLNVSVAASVFLFEAQRQRYITKEE